MKLEKMTRRSLAMLLVMMMVFSLAVPAFADTGIADGTAVSEEDHNHNNEATSETENGEAVIDENQNLGEADPSEEESGNAAILMTAKRCTNTRLYMQITEQPLVQKSA